MCCGVKLNFRSLRSIRLPESVLRFLYFEEAISINLFGEGCVVKTAKVKVRTVNESAHNHLSYVMTVEVKNCRNRKAELPGKHYTILCTKKSKARTSQYAHAFMRLGEHLHRSWWPRGNVIR